MAAKKKLTLYFPQEVVDDARREAERQDRSISWILQTAWRIAREDIEAQPSVKALWGLDTATSS